MSSAVKPAATSKPGLLNSYLHFFAEVRARGRVYTPHLAFTCSFVVHGAGDHVSLTLAANAKAAFYHACSFGPLRRSARLMSRLSRHSAACGGCAAAAAGWREALRSVRLVRCAQHLRCATLPADVQSGLSLLLRTVHKYPSVVLRLPPSSSWASPRTRPEPCRDDALRCRVLSAF